MLKYWMFGALLGLLSGIGQAQGSLVVNVSPAYGPPGTVFSITIDGGGFEGYPVECTVNGAFVGFFDYYGVWYNYSTPSNAPNGTVFVVYCYQLTVPDSGPLAGTNFFTVIITDTDGDGIDDKDDACPSVFAKTPNGCPPDSDSDTLPDDVDACPNQPGPTATQGCPDSDGDGFTDSDDACPNAVGIAPDGCPDSDRDGFTDNNDACPKVFGTAPDGCPRDSDGDGFADSNDACPNVVGTTPDGCPPPTNAVPMPSATPARILPRPADFPIFPQFAACANLRQQANLPLTQWVRLSVTDNPCASLTELLRRQRFGRPNLPSPISEARRAELRCPSDPRPIPSADWLRLEANFARQGSRINLSWAGMSEAELCAAQAGDPFRLARARNVLSTLERAEYYTASCYGLLTGAQMREALARLRAGADAEVATLLISALSNDGLLSVQRMTWCTYLQRRILNISQADIDQQNDLLRTLVECRVLQSGEVDTWRVRISEGQMRFTWSDLARYIASLGNRCPSDASFRAFVADPRGSLNASRPATDSQELLDYWNACLLRLMAFIFRPQTIWWGHTCLASGRESGSC